MEDVPEFFFFFEELLLALDEVETDWGEVSLVLPLRDCDFIGALLFIS